MSKIKRTIEQLLVSARERNIDIKGNAEGLWFVIGKVRLDPRFNVPETSVMIKFEKASNNPAVLIPEEVSIKLNAGISDSFIESSTYIEGWRCIFPGLFLDVDGELIELIFGVAGILANLSLYNLVSPENVEVTEERRVKEVIAEFVDTDKQDNN